jgi:hypothetical protein
MPTTVSTISSLAEGELRGIVATQVLSIRAT